MAKRIGHLLTTPIFWLMTLSGHVFIFTGAWAMNFFEGSVNPQAERYIDCLTWAFGIITTVGATELHPQTIFGKILMILMMIGGAVFLWTYMTLFIAALVGPELNLIEKEVSELQKISKHEDQELLVKIQRLIEDSKK